MAKALLVFLLAASSRDGLASDDHARGVLIRYTESRTSESSKRAQNWLRSQGYSLSYQVRFAAIDHWARKTKMENQVDDVRLCRELNDGLWRESIKACGINTKLRPDEHLSNLDFKKPGNVDSDEACVLLEKSPILDGLSTYWAQEYVGLDLAMARWEEWSRNLPKTEMANVSRLAVIDGSAATDLQHGLHVMHLISRWTPEGAAKTPGAKWRIDQTEVLPGFEDVLSAVSYLKALDQYPLGLDVINLSRGRFGSVVAEAYDDYSKHHKTLTVVASGNEGADESATREKQSMKQVILVGSLRPDGLMSDFSSMYPNVTISAPSNHEIISEDPRDPFSGTSGAAPLVSAALAMVKSVLPTLEVNEAKQILELTAVPTWNSFEVAPRLNGSGMLNAYKALNLAIELRQACGPASQSSGCLRTALEKKANIQNATVDLNLERDVTRAFGCSASDSQAIRRSEVSCKEIKAVLTRLRKAAFSEPRVGPYWKMLECVHRGLKLDQNAEFYRKLSLQGWPPKDASQMRLAIAKDLSQMKVVRKDDRDWTESLGPRRISWSLLMNSKDFKKGLMSPSVVFRDDLMKAVTTMAPIMPTSDLDLIVSQALKDKVLTVRARAVELAGYLPALKSDSILKDASTASDKGLQSAAINACRYMPVDRAEPVLRSALNSSDSFIRIDALVAARAFPKERLAPLVEKALKDPSPYVRLNALRSAILLPLATATPLIQVATNDSDESVRKEAVGAMALLKKLSFRSH